MSAPALRQGRCPSCGANLEFKIGSSRATICEHCKAVVARSGQDLSLVGKVADLIPTTSPISLGTHGKLHGAPFEVIGRLQYQWEAGVWDEWNIGFADGRFGWLAEAQGKLYVTFLAPSRALPAKVTAGESVFLQGLGRFVAIDVKRARIVGAAGELPDPVALGESPLTVDLESEKGGFATLDYGPQGSSPREAKLAARLFVGEQVDFASLGLSGIAPLAEQRQARPTGEALRCPNCSAPISLRLPEESERVVCDHCGMLLDCSQGTLAVIEAIQRGKHEPRLAIGANGSLRGARYVIAGWMIKTCKVDGVRYPWDEYLLWNESARSFAWLVESNGHWQLATPLSAGEVHVANDASYQGHRFRHYSSVIGEVQTVLGEFYWAVHAGEAAQLDDYIAPPEGLSRERTSGEVNWSHLAHLDASEVGAAFQRPGLEQKASGVGEVQPWPHEDAWKTMGHWVSFGIAALLALLIAFALRPPAVLVNQIFPERDATAGDASGVTMESAPSGELVQSFISEPFELSGREALRVVLRTSVEQSWAYASGAVINDTSGVSSPFGIETSYYSGVDQGESWSEGNRNADEVFQAPGAGSSVLRVDLQWDPKRPKPWMQLQLTTSRFSVWQFFAALSLLLVWPLLMSIQRASFEKERWSDSNVNPRSWTGE